MDASGLIRYKSRSAYYFWIGVFFVGLFGLIGLLYYATLQIEYTWGWYRLPSYFANHETVEINAEIDGRVDDISKSGGKTIIRVKGDDGVESYEVPSGGEIRVDNRDRISSGNTLATYKEWRAGIMAQGMWITLKVSLYSIIFGIIIGVIGGVARISSNTAFRWWAMTYVELIRGSPLLVQIFIWYFVLATVINQILMKFGLSEIPVLWYGVASLACFTGAYVTEIVRAGIQSIHRGQIEAALKN